MDMIERVAEAIKECVADRIEHMPEFWRVHARAAIEAMREPTAAMRKAIDESDELFDGEGYRMDPETAACAWRAMIDAALAKEPASAD